MRVQHGGVWFHVHARAIVPTDSATDRDLVDDGILSLVVYEGRNPKTSQRVLYWRAQNSHGKEVGLLQKIKPKHFEAWDVRIQTSGLPLDDKGVSWVWGSRNVMPYNKVRRAVN